MPFTPLTVDDQPTIATFNEKFQEAIQEAIQESFSKSLFSYGQYVGTGKIGASNPNSLTFDRKPFAVIIYSYGKTGVSSLSGYVIPFEVLTTEYKSGVGFWSGNTNNNSYAKVSEDGKTVYWYNTYNTTNAYMQANGAGEIYRYIVLYENEETA